MATFNSTRNDFSVERVPGVVSEDGPSAGRGESRRYIDARGVLRGALPVTLGAAGVTAWCFLALQRPSTTYHFAPLVSALIVPTAGRVRSGTPLARPVALRLAGVGFLLAVAGTAVLVIAHALRGPTLLGSRKATLEAFTFAVPGALLGLRVALRRRSGWLLRDTCLSSTGCADHDTERRAQRT
jgi:hypothetical protein